MDGIEVLGLQLLEQWRLWLGPDVPLPVDAARQKMRDLASGNVALNGSSEVGFYERSFETAGHMYLHIEGRYRQ